MEHESPRIEAKTGAPPARPSAPDGALTVRNLMRVYPGGAGVNGLDLVAEHGQLISLLGASGCGKTTTLRCLAGIDSPDSGEIWINGRPVFSSADRTNIAPERRNIGMVFQSYALWPHLTALENVAFPLRARKVPRQQARERAKAMLEVVGLGKLAERSPDQLSGGQQQRVALARALVHQPDLLLFDEPLSNLDAELRESVRQDIRRIQQESGVTAIYVTHDRTEAMALSDRMLIMADGRLVQDGTPRELLARPASPFVASLLGSANVVRGTVERSVPDADGAAITVVTAGGTRFTGHAYESLERGSAVVVCIRPTTIRVSGLDGKPANGELVARIRDCYPTGPEFEYQLEIEGEGGPQIKAVTSADLGFAPGQDVRLAYDVEAAIVFPAPSRRS